MAEEQTLNPQAPATPPSPDAMPAPGVAMPAPGAGKKSRLGMSGKTRQTLYDQLATLIGSGVTLVDSLNIVAAQTREKKLKELYAEMNHSISSGTSLAEAMRLFPRAFPEMQAALVEAAEKSGKLKEVFESMAADLESQQDFTRKVTGAMMYPAILVCLALTLVAGMMIFVIPRIAAMYEDAQVELPGLTQLMIGLSHFVQAQWPFLLGGITGFLLLVWALVHYTRQGTLAWESLVFGLPMFGRIAREKCLASLSANMGLLLSSGVLIAQAFEITEKTVGNLHYRTALEKIRHGLVLGAPVSELMGLKNIKDARFRQNPLFPLQVAQLVNIGETTGTLAKMFFKIHANYKKSIDYTLKNISNLIEPLMILVVASLVGTILLAVMLPFFYIGTTIS